MDTMLSWLGTVMACAACTYHRSVLHAASTEFPGWSTRDRVVPGASSVRCCVVGLLCVEGPALCVRGSMLTTQARRLSCHAAASCKSRPSSFLRLCTLTLRWVASLATKRLLLLRCTSTLLFLFFFLPPVVVSRCCGVCGGMGVWVPAPPCVTTLPCREVQPGAYRYQRRAPRFLVRSFAAFSAQVHQFMLGQHPVAAMLQTVSEVFSVRAAHTCRVCCVASVATTRQKLECRCRAVPWHLMSLRSPVRLVCPPNLPIPHPAHARVNR